VNIAFQNEANQLIKKINWRQKLLMRVFGKKINLGEEKREEWTGAILFYLFYCKYCGHYVKDYPHGHLERRYLICSACEVKHNFVPWWVGWAKIWQLIRFRFGQFDQ